MTMRNNKYSSVLSLCQGEVRYGCFPIVAIDKIEVFPSTITIIEGPNGSGKTSLFRSIAGIQAQFSGDIIFRSRLLNNIPAHDRVRLGIRFIPQDRRVFNRLTFRQHLALSKRILRDPKTKNQVEDLESFKKAVELVGDVDKYGSYLSGGQVKAMLLLCTMYDRPRILMLDEPYAGLDDVGRTIIQPIINTCLDSGGACLVSDHTGIAQAEFGSTCTYEIISNYVAQSSSPVQYRLVEK